MTEGLLGPLLQRGRFGEQCSNPVRKMPGIGTHPHLLLQILPLFLIKLKTCTALACMYASCMRQRKSRHATYAKCLIWGPPICSNSNKFFIFSDLFSTSCRSKKPPAAPHMLSLQPAGPPCKASSATMWPYRPLLLHQ